MKPPLVKFGATPGGDAAPETNWLPADSAFYGIPLSVRESLDSPPLTSIRDPYIGWWDENRQHVLPFVPIEWSPID